MADDQSGVNFGWWHVVGGAVVGLLPGAIRSKMAERQAKAEQQAAMAHQVELCFLRLNLLEGRIDAKDSEIADLRRRIEEAHCQGDLKDERISALESQLAAAERDRDQFRAELDATAAKVASLEANSCPSNIRPENCPMNATDFDYLNLPRWKEPKGDPKGD